MKDALERLRVILDTVPARLRAISEAESLRRPAADRWSRKEILRHLGDSARDNHQRFVSAQLVEELHCPPYEQEGWVTVQRYPEERSATIVELWLAYTRHPRQVTAGVPGSALPPRRNRP